MASSPLSQRLGHPLGKQLGTFLLVLRQCLPGAYPFGKGILLRRQLDVLGKIGSHRQNDVPVLRPVALAHAKTADIGRIECQGLGQCVVLRPGQAHQKIQLLGNMDRHVQ